MVRRAARHRQRSKASTSWSVSGTGCREAGRFVDSEGRPFQLADVLHQGKPVILTLVYYRCPALCSLVLSGLTRSLRGLDLKLGEDYRVVTLSIDPTETPRMAAESKRGHMQAMGIDPLTPAWTFGTGNDEADSPPGPRRGLSIHLRRAEQAVRPRRGHLRALARRKNLPLPLRHRFSKPRDMRLALVEAGQGKVGTALDRVLLTCFKYDPSDPPIRALRPRLHPHRGARWSSSPWRRFSQCSGDRN